MSEYSTLAKYYDRFMADFPYNKWGDFLVPKLDITKPMLELACGTGNLTMELYKRGFKISGLDLDTNMLSIAQCKGWEEGLSVNFFQQNMIRASIKGYNDIICPCDGINSLTNPEDLERFFGNIASQLRGKFIFDFSTKAKLLTLDNQVFYEDHEDVTYFWETQYSHKEDIATMHLTFFTKQKNGSYLRDDTIITQRGLTLEYILKLLEKYNLNDLGVYDDYTDKAPNSYSQRIVIECKKIK